MNTTIMASGTFRLKGRQLYGKGIAEGRVSNKTEISDRSGMTYPTALRWIENSRDISSISFDNLAGFLIDGLGIPPEEVARMSFGEIFEYIPGNDKAE